MQPQQYSPFRRGARPDRSAAGEPSQNELSGFAMCRLALAVVVGVVLVAEFCDSLPVWTIPARTARLVASRAQHLPRKPLRRSPRQPRRARRPQSPPNPWKSAKSRSHKLPSLIRIAGKALFLSQRTENSSRKPAPFRHTLTADGPLPNSLTPPDPLSMVRAVDLPAAARISAFSGWFEPCQPMARVSVRRWQISPEDREAIRQRSAEIGQKLDALKSQRATCRADRQVKTQLSPPSDQPSSSRASWSSGWLSAAASAGRSTGNSVRRRG